MSSNLIGTDQNYNLKTSKVFYHHRYLFLNIKKVYIKKNIIIIWVKSIKFTFSSYNYRSKCFW